MPGGLTGPELQVLALITSGFTSVQMSQRLKTSAKTLENRRRSLFRKLGVQSQSQAVVVAVASGILGPAPASPPPL
jgi:DNA-binding CsgD family transcriptional regulator